MVLVCKNELKEIGDLLSQCEEILDKNDCKSAFVKGVLFGIECRIDNMIEENIDNIESDS